MWHSVASVNPLALFFTAIRFVLCCKYFFSSLLCSKIVHPTVPRTHTACCKPGLHILLLSAYTSKCCGAKCGERLRERQNDADSASLMRACIWGCWSVMKSIWENKNPFPQCKSQLTEMHNFFFSPFLIFFTVQTNPIREIK